MNYTYRLISESTVFRNDGMAIPLVDGNQDYEIYLKWLSEGNTPLPPYQE
jgi:hypothetical protein